MIALLISDGKLCMMECKIHILRMADALADPGYGMVKDLTTDLRYAI